MTRKLLTSVLAAAALMATTSLPTQALDLDKAKPVKVAVTTPAPTSTPATTAKSALTIASFLDRDVGAQKTSTILPAIVVTDKDMAKGLGGAAAPARSVSDKLMMSAAGFLEKAKATYGTTWTAALAAKYPLGHTAFGFNSTAIALTAADDTIKRGVGLLGVAYVPAAMIDDQTITKVNSPVTYADLAALFDNTKFYQATATVLGMAADQVAHDVSQRM